ncbi:MAG: LON peptidase substrate-binding domain-containing protein [Candidatus Dormiibacterota bacterium]
MPDLPLFPLRVVLYPHMPLPIHVFEPRYQTLLRDCQRDGGRFGVVAIRSGPEVGGPAEPERVGTVAITTKRVPLPDGRSHLLVTGGRRFQITRLLTGTPYLRAKVNLLEDQGPDPASFILASEAGAALTRYAARLARITGRRPSSNPNPTDPILLSWVIASALMVELAHKQSLLEQASVSARLRQEIELLKREVTFLDLELANRIQMAPSYDRN